MKDIISKIFFSMQSMAVLILLFAFSIGAATFIENDFGTIAAKAMVYNAVWFNVLLGLLALNLVVNIFRYKMYKRQKFTVFLFHLAFLIILLGAGITRFVSFEGMMHLREGQQSHTILSDRTYVQARVIAGDKEVDLEKHVLLSALTPSFNQDIAIGEKQLNVKALKYVPNAREVIATGNSGPAIITLVASMGGGRKDFYLREGSRENIDGYLIQFGGPVEDNAFNIIDKGNQLQFFINDTVRTTSMRGAAAEVLLPGRFYPFVSGKLYTVGNFNLVLTHRYDHGKIDYVPYEGKDLNMMDALVVSLKSGNETKTVALRGGKGYKGTLSNLELNGLMISMSYGSKEINLPFSIKLNDFELDRYPGSMSPSSYASRVTVIDNEKNKSFPFHIYMNHVLNYRGYRFFQSSYDRDELGSILSVNHDYWGTFFTYIGYFLLALGMFLSLANRNSHFAALGRFLKKSGQKTRAAGLILILLLTFGASSSYAQHGHLSIDKIPKIDKVQAEKFGKLMVQGNDGRVEPVNTLASELLRKIAWKNSFHGLSPDEVLLGMLSEPLYWQQVPIIKIGDKELKKALGIQGKYASYLDFIDMKNGTYKLQQMVSAVYAKKPAQRGVLDKEVMKADERLNVCYMIYTGQLLKMVPDPTNPTHPWYSPASKPEKLSGQDSLMVVSVIPEYMKAVGKGELKLANELIDNFSAYQKKYGASIMPSERKIKAELWYNKLMIFNRLSIWLGMLGLVMVILTFVELFRTSKLLRIILKVFVWVIALLFVAYTYGLGLRWYISGHAPWSNGFESMIYIGWVTLFAGLLFSKGSKMTVAATTILASIILMVAHLSWMDPEITNLVPVLKSYWLTIHVSVITASYGFLALSMLLGLINLVIMIFKNPANQEKLSQRIADLSAINERTMIIGLYMLTIGTFLGGVWANESWGRYWGWDPKETWALVSVLVYSFIVHMRYIPSLNSRFSFNVASVVGYFSILMTYFGVNYYLSGLHSYAKGDPVPIPNFVYYMIGILILLVVWAYNNEKRLEKENA
jgi:cytochrome c-type biogenesis protein CcsB